jgi:hypothetical protein
MVVLQINYRFQNVSPEEWAKRYTDATGQKFLSVAGLQWKIWLDGEGTNVGGIYLFDTRANAEAYLAGPIVAGMKANPNVADLRFTLSDVRERMSAITHAPVPGLAPVQHARASAVMETKAELVKLANSLNPVVGYCERTASRVRRCEET